MISTKLHAGRSSTSNPSRPTITNVPYLCYDQSCTRASKLPSHNILDANDDINEDIGEVQECNKVEDIS